jgi:magnesium-transporting ATPase (P-type)
MLKAASKKRSNIDIQSIQRIARESRSETLARLQASAEGLSTNKAEENRREYGKNEIITNTNASKWRLLWESVATPFTVVLLVLTLLTLFTSYILIPQGNSDSITIIVMVIMLIVSVLVNFIQKIKIARVTDQLLNRVSVTTNIRRDGHNVELPTDEVVIGDVINLSAGDMIPADMKLLTSKDLFCSSSYLDGDPEPAEKVANVIIKPSMSNDYLNYPNILYEGTTIVSGSGTGIVFAIGNHTVFGKEVQAISRKKVKTTLFDREMKQLAKILIVATAIIIPLLFVINGLTKGDWGESLIFALAAAVGLTPEVLPIIVNSNLTKGAAEGMLAISNKVELNGKVEDLTSEWKERILNQINELNVRVLLVGYKLNPAPVGEFSAKDEHDLTIIGYLAYLDPPKETTKEALEDLKNDNVDVKIFTGDNEAVTRVIALQVGLNVDTVYDGKQIDEASPEELKEIVEKCDIFVHLTPELRVKIINALKTNGHTVGYMGDGNKDALAMKVADVTVTSNSSVDITKESADIVFEQKDLQLLEEMIMVGRKVFSNTMKYIKTFLVTNMGSIIAMAVSSLLLPFLPLLPLQVLILNLLFSLSCLVIPFDSVSENYVKKPQKWSIRMWPKFVLNFGPIPAIVDFIAMALMFYVICPYLVGSNYHHWVFISLFYSGIFVESLWTRVMIIHTLRDERFPFFKQHATPIVFLVTFGLAILGTMLPSSSIAPSLGLTQLPFSYWAVVLLLEVIYILLTTLVKHLYLKKEKF